MSVMIYDSTSQSFKEAETPKIFSPTDSAWEYSVGRVYNPTEQAWEEKWRKAQLLYDEGNECTSETGGWDCDGYIHDSNHPNDKNMVKKSDCISLGYSSSADYVSVIGSNNLIKFSGFKKMKIDMMITSQAPEGYGPVLRLSPTKNITNGILKECPNNKGEISFNIRKVYEYEIDGISTAYISFSNYASNRFGGAGYIYKIWLE